MAKVVRCRDVGMNCDHEVRGSTEDEVMQKAAAHAREAHGMSQIPPEVAAKVKAAIRNE